MKTNTGLLTLAVAALAIAPAAGLAKGPGGGQGGGNPQVQRGQQDVDRTRARDRVDNPAQDRDKMQDRMRDRDRIHTPGTDKGKAAGNGNGIYGQQLMSEEERNRFREELRQIGDDPQKRAKFMAGHREEMQKRAKAKGIELDADAGAD